VRKVLRLVAAALRRPTSLGRSLTIATRCHAIHLRCLAIGSCVLPSIQLALAHRRVVDQAVTNRGLGIPLGRSDVALVSSPISVTGHSRRQ